MGNLKFSDLHDDIIPCLIENGITENDLFDAGEKSTDAYIGCKSRTQAQKILRGGIWGALSSIFAPQKGSDMEHYPVAVDIAFGNISKAVSDIAKLK